MRFVRPGNDGGVGEQETENPREDDRGEELPESPVPDPEETGGDTEDVPEAD